MDDLLDDLVRAARRCERAARSMQQSLAEVREPIQQQVQNAQRAWSGSWIGYHSRVYIKDFDAPRSDERFDREWGVMSAYGSQTCGRWSLYDEEAAKDVLLRRAQVSTEKLDALEDQALRAR